MKAVLPKIIFIGVLRVMNVTWMAALPVPQGSVVFLTSLLDAERARRGTRARRRVLSTFDQAVLVLRWFLDATRVRQLAPDKGHRQVDWGLWLPA